MEDWKKAHVKIMSDFVTYVNSQSKSFILKGGSALLLVYHSERFSDNLNFDGLKKGIFRNIVDSFVEHRKDFGYSDMSADFAVPDKNSEQAVISYGGERALKVTVSYSKMIIPYWKYSKSDGICFYDNESLLMMKTVSLAGDFRVEDIYDSVFLYFRGINWNSSYSVFALSEVIARRGFDYFTFILKEHEKEGIDCEKLLSDVKKMYESLNVAL